MAREHNFSAGPALLPLSVVEQLQATLPELGETGMGLMEISHRSAAFEAIRDSAEARLRSLMGVPDDYAVLFLQGGASFQFYMHARNLLAGQSDKADILLTGRWADSALVEMRRCGDVQAAWSPTSGEPRRVPAPGEPTLRDDALYLHYTTNNTVSGSQFHTPPQTGKPLVGDMSSDICSRPVDVTRHAVIYAGAQKNLGPSGVTAVIVSPWAMEQSARVDKIIEGGLPSMLDYRLMAKKQSMFNTPNTFGIFALDRVLSWIEDHGGVTAMEARNLAKSSALYTEIDRTDFWQGYVAEGSRSIMNPTWGSPSAALDKTFVSEAADAGLLGLKGHRSVGGLRASIYNACELSSVQALIGFMQDFERRHG
ncbi:MAG: phosphoserine aminotransferase [Myxococcota bacterium]|jgi:phosphoserine aminotransferase